MHATQTWNHDIYVAACHDTKSASVHPERRFAQRPRNPHCYSTTIDIVALLSSYVLFRQVHESEGVAAAYRQVASEVAGSPIFVMRLAPRSRHLEVQLLADTYGEVTKEAGFVGAARGCFRESERERETEKREKRERGVERFGVAQTCCC